MNKIIKLFLLAFFTTFSLITTILLVNLLLPKIFSNYEIGYIKLAVLNSTFSSKYIFWKKPYCKKDCQNPLEEISGYKVTTFGENYGNCEKVLFLGDSFTDAPWDGEGRSYAEHFVEKLSQVNESCYVLVRLAAPATNNDQQFAMLSDSIVKINPKLVVWQFCWNDVFENADKRLYFKDKNNEFKRHDATSNMYFWSGWLYQKIPLIRNTNLGSFLLYFGELKRDLLFDWNGLVNNKDLLYSTNNDKVNYFLNELKSMSERDGFKFITTLAPLECELGFPKDCVALDEETNQYKYTIFLNDYDHLLNTLKNNYNFISMHDNESMAEEQKLNQADFRDKIEEPGISHLSASGLQKAGNILLLNFLSVNDQKDNLYDEKN